MLSSKQLMSELGGLMAGGVVREHACPEKHSICSSGIVCISQAFSAKNLSIKPLACSNERTML